MKSSLKPELRPDLPFDEGFILPINKPYGWSSSDVVRKLKYRLQRLGFRKIKIGHAGTLDPLATGVLLICIGRAATKQVDALQAQEKEYLAGIRLGATTPSSDMEHPVDKTYPYEHITEQMVRKALSEMEGEQLQMPPVYSAKLIEGKRAYEYARQGKDVEMRRALINIYGMELKEFSLPDITVSIRCSKGTYIRSIARDLGEKLDSGGYLTSLCRTTSGNYSLQSCYEVDEAVEILASGEKITVE